MQLQPDTVYSGPDDRDVYIVGLVKRSPTVPGKRIFYSRCGEWYREDGVYMEYDPKTGKMFPIRNKQHTSGRNWRDLKEKK